MIDVKEVTKIYRLGSCGSARAAGCSFRIERGEVLAIMGQSGSGKSTLMNILGCLDLPTSGEYLLDGTEMAGLSEDELADDPQPEDRLRLPAVQPAARAHRAAQCRAAADSTTGRRRPQKEITPARRGHLGGGGVG